MKKTLFLFVISSLFYSCLILAGEVNDATEPSIDDQHSISLINEDSWDGWKVPSDCWSIEGGVITGNTGPEPIRQPEWLYTNARFADFIFSCELRLTGSHQPNSGIYFRVNPIQYQWKEHTPIYEAASGYEYDVAPGKLCGSLGDWYARPKLRVFVDKDIVLSTFRENEWNRMTIRAIGNRFEYWLNGIKIMDFTDNDPKGFREGIIGLQIHDNAVMKIEMRQARVLPISNK